MKIHGKGLLLLFLGVCPEFSWGADVSTHVLGALKQTLDPSTDTVKAGYYAATKLSVVDAYLVGANIKSGVNVLGFTGAYVGHNLPDTGQTTVYAGGDDASYQPAATQLSYTDNGNGTITDNVTGLMWKKCSEPDTTTGCSGAHNTYTWANAIAQCEGLTYPSGSYSDWRLPNVKELFSILREEGPVPFINLTYFPNPASA
jgi:hypothetical protein